MPLWVWIILVAIAFSLTAYRKYRESSALRQRQKELASQRANRPNSETSGS